MSLKMMQKPAYVISIVTMLVMALTAVKGQTTEEPTGAISRNGAKIKAAGQWYGYAYQGTGEAVNCYRGDVHNENGEQINIRFTYSDRKAFSGRYFYSTNGKNPVTWTVYDIAEDGSRGPKVCEAVAVDAGSHGNFVKFVGNSPCPTTPVVNFTVLCLTKTLNLKDDDKEELQKLCPSPNFSLISEKSC